MTPIERFVEEAIVWTFQAFDARSSLRRKVVSTIVLVPVGSLYCAGLIAHAIWGEADRG